MTLNNSKIMPRPRRMRGPSGVKKAPRVNWESKSIEARAGSRLAGPFTPLVKAPRVAVQYRAKR